MSKPSRTNVSLSSRFSQTPSLKLPKSPALQLPKSTVKQPPKSKAATQFQSWVSDKEALQREASKADLAREDLEKKLKEISQQQVETKEKIHHASNELGGVHRQRELLLAEKAGLEKTLAQERVELEERAKAIEKARTEEREKKQKFCKEVEELNRELGILLREQEAARLKKLIFAETTNIIVAHHQKASDPSDSPDSLKDDTLRLQEMEKAAVELRKKTTLRKNAVVTRARLRSKLSEARSRAMKIRQTNSPTPTKVRSFRISKRHCVRSCGRVSDTMESVVVRSRPRCTRSEVEARQGPCHNHDKARSRR
jgi:chromosome segregation ATPase